MKSMKSMNKGKTPFKKLVKKMSENGCSWTFSKIGLTNDH